MDPRTDAAADGAAYGTARVAAALAAAAPYEFLSYLCGTQPPGGLDSRAAEAWRHACNRALAKALHAEWGGTRTVDHLRPDVQVVLRRDPERVEIDAAPLFVLGRYRKHSREVSQTPFHCRACRGRGRRRGRAAGPCGGCGGTGRVVARAVSDFIVGPLVEAAAGESGAFHGCGREDVDVRMLGSGRPFGVQVEQPRRRRLDLAGIGVRAAAAAAGDAEFLDLRVADREALRALTTTHPAKRYRARVLAERAITPEEAARLAAALTGAALAQRTPDRVAATRADLVRERRVHACRVEALPDGTADLHLRTDGGTYVKELVSGDGGRTEPSVASILGRPARCVELDVTEVESERSPGE